jgi:hypothetical protein
MRKLTESEVGPWVQDTLLSKSRTQPIVAVTSHPHTERAWVDPEELQRELGDLSVVVFLATGEPTWALSEALPPRLDVYGGALRIWWPGLTTASDPYAHRLYFVSLRRKPSGCSRRLLPRCANARNAWTWLRRWAAPQPHQFPAPGTEHRSSCAASHRPNRPNSCGSPRWHRAASR